MKILVTGGCGYIGSHTIVDLIDNGFDVVCVDDNSRSTPALLKGIKKITGVAVPHYAYDLCDLAKVEELFKAHPDIEGVIHFAAYKSVPESVKAPLKYYHNNLSSLINLLRVSKEYALKYFIFSSSCSVYGNAEALPVTEHTPLQEAESPYAYTKQSGERILLDLAKSDPAFNVVLLRYFNPVGAHSSAEIGEVQEKPENLVPYITQTAIGKRDQLTVFGKDYETRDGTCIRDYIHVMDIANAHTKALEYVIANKNEENAEVFNLGSGNGVTVLELIQAFEKVSEQKLNYVMGDRRPGDVVAIYANNEKATSKLGWEIKYSIEEMMRTAWEWECKMHQKSSN